MPSNNAKRSYALLATAAITLSGFATAPVAIAAEETSATTTASSSSSTISNATMSWGLKESFRTYFEKAFVAGTITTDGGLTSTGNGILGFSSGTGTYDASTKTGKIVFPGSVNYVGHHGQLDIKLNTFTLEINGNTGTLKVTGSSKDMQGNVHTFSDSDFATVDLSGATITNSEISLNGGATSLTETGASAFAGFYTAGTELDPITFSAPLTTAEETAEPTPSASETPSPSASESTPATAPALPEYKASEGNLAEGSMNWGIKEAFRTYILTNPYAKGTQTLDGVTYTDTYGFSTGTGNYDEASKTGEISFPGTIKYSAHNGVLDIALTNVTVKINGDKGEIIADGYTRNGRTGEYDSFTDRVIQTVDLTGLKVEEGKLVVENAATAFTAEGGATFGRYTEADATDPISFTATVKAAEETPAPSPSASETPAPSASETPSPKASETPAPAPSESATRFNVESGTMSWGFKDSFRKYISGPIANGATEVSDSITVTSNGFDWSKISDGAFDTATGEGFAKFDGSVHFTGHHGQLDLTFSNIQFQTYKENGELKGYIVADVESKLLSGGTLKKEKLTIAVVNTEGLKFADGKVTLDSAAVALTESGAIAFATDYNESTGEYNSMYKPGEVLSPLSLNLTLGKEIDSDKKWDRNGVIGDTTKAPDNGTKESDTKGTDPTQSDENKAVENGGGTSGTSGQLNTNSTTLGDQKTGGASTNPGSSAAATCVPVQVTETVPGTTTNKATGKSVVSSANMDWGLRTSFRNYIAGGIANGGWKLDGVTYASGAFKFSSGSGSIENGSGTVSFGGSINFYGHHGVLDTTFSNLSLEINGKTGVLYADVVSNDMQGKSTNYGRVAFANVDLASISISDSKLTISSAATNLTAEGAKAFAGFYAAGEGMDPISLSADLKGETTSVTSEPTTVTKTVYKGDNCDSLNAAAAAKGSTGSGSGSSSNSSLAYTGAGATPILITAGGILLLAGAAATVVARRRSA